MIDNLNNGCVDNDETIHASIMAGDCMCPNVFFYLSRSTGYISFVIEISVTHSGIHGPLGDNENNVWTPFFIEKYKEGDLLAFCKIFYKSPF